MKSFSRVLKTLILLCAVVLFTGMTVNQEAIFHKFFGKQYKSLNCKMTTISFTDKVQPEQKEGYFSSGMVPNGIKVNLDIAVPIGTVEHSNIKINTDGWEEKGFTQLSDEGDSLEMALLNSDTKKWQDKVLVEGTVDFKVAVKKESIDLGFADLKKGIKGNKYNAEIKGIEPGFFGDETKNLKVSLEYKSDLKLLDIKVLNDKDEVIGQGMNGYSSFSGFSTTKMEVEVQLEKPLTDKGKVIVEMATETELINQPFEIEFAM